MKKKYYEVLGLVAAIILVQLLVITNESSAQTKEHLVIRYLPSVEDDAYSNNPYYQELLKLALEETVDTFGSYTLVEGAGAKTVLDALKMMRTDEGIDIVHTNTDKTRERVLVPIRIPLDKGLIGIRLVLKTSDSVGSFEGIKTLNDLKKYSYGQGFFWPDTEILRHNSLNVKMIKEYEALFTQLEAGEFDGFPRSILEIWDELESQNNKNFSIAEGFYFYYPVPIYFFVRKDELGAKIAQRIETGLREAIKNGKFDELFQKHMQPYLDKANLEQRVGIPLENPLLPEQTPLNEAALWYLNYK